MSDNTGKRYEKKNFLKKITSSSVEKSIGRFDAKRGTLHKIALEAKQPNNINIIGIVAIENSDNEIYSLNVQLTDVTELHFVELKLLLTVQTNEERLNTVLDPEQFKRTLNTEISDAKSKFQDSEHDTKYGIIKDICSYGIGLCFYVSFKMSLNQLLL